MILVGKISEFGGPDDLGMRYSEGCSFYEHWEADLRPDLFLERSKDPIQGSSHRLRCNDAYYIALNLADYPRAIIHQSRWRVTNLITGDSVVCQVVDRGPSASGRLVDASMALMRAIGVKTDDHVQVAEVTQFDIPFGLYEKKT